MLAVHTSVRPGSDEAARTRAAGLVSEFLLAGDGRGRSLGGRGRCRGWAAGMQADTGMMARLKAMVPGNLFNKVP